MNTFLRNTISKLYNAVSAPVAATRDALAERLQGVRETASLLYNRMVENMGYGREKLKNIVEKEAGEEQQHEDECEEDVYLTRHEHERALKEHIEALWCPESLRRTLIVTLIRPSYTSRR